MLEKIKNAYNYLQKIASFSKHRENQLELIN